MFNVKKYELLRYLNYLGKKEYVRKNYSLDLLTEALKLINEPHKKIRNVIHITGTNGKGSVAIYVSQILSSLGYNTGLFISPHLFHVTERIQVNNQPITYSLLQKYIERIYNSLPKQLFLQLTYFELLTCVMFLYFSEIQLDFVILEVGLGGKLDATNVVPHSIISCITSISLDHTDVLGKTEFSILKDKSGIIKSNSIFVCGVNNKKFQRYLKKICKSLNTKFVYVGDNVVKNVNIDFNKWITVFSYSKKNIKFVLPICSVSQPYNVAIALKIVEELSTHGFIKKINYRKIARNLRKIIIPFRMQKCNLDGLTIVVDGAHNQQAVKNFVSTIKMSPFDNLVICFTIMKDKDCKNIIKTLSTIRKKVKKFIVYRLNTIRSQNLELLYNETKKYFGEKVYKHSNCNRLLTYLKKFCNDNKIFFVGSFYVSVLFRNQYGKIL